MTKSKSTQKRGGITHIPFVAKPRIQGEEVSTELMAEIEKCAKRWKKHPHDFSARIELLPYPMSKEGHYLWAEVTYLKGILPSLPLKAKKK